jgi:hypothetical protein
MNTIADFLGMLNWINGKPLMSVMELYRIRIFERAFERDENGHPRHNLILSGRAKKNWKTGDAVLGGFNALLDTSPSGNDVIIVANDEDQAGDDLDLAKKIVRANPLLDEILTIRKNAIERNDGNGSMQILPAKDALGMHGKTYRLLIVDEIHGYRNYDVLEGLAPDPTRLDAQIWITSYASLFHKPGVPLYDLMQTGKAGSDPRMLFSWYAADYCTDPDFADKSPEERANPSMASWGNPGYLAQQQRRLPSHKYRRLHLNLPGLPEGSAYQPDPIADAIDRGVKLRDAQQGDRAFVDMSGGSNDDAVLAISRPMPDGSLVLVRVLNQGAPVPFDPRLAVERFAKVLKEHGIKSVTGDRYAGETFKKDFERHQITYRISDKTKHEIYEAFEPLLNGGKVRLVDVPTLEQQLLGLVWRGGRIDHRPGEHDDFANAGCGAIVLASSQDCGLRVRRLDLADANGNPIKAGWDIARIQEAYRARGRAFGDK